MVQNRTRISLGLFKPYHIYAVILFRRLSRALRRSRLVRYSWYGCGLIWTLLIACYTVGYYNDKQKLGKCLIKNLCTSLKGPDFGKPFQFSIIYVACNSVSSLRNLYIATTVQHIQFLRHVLMRVVESVWCHLISHSCHPTS